MREFVRSPLSPEREQKLAFSELMTSWYPWFGWVAMSEDAISVRGVLDSTPTSGGFQVVHRDREIQLVPMTLSFWVMGYTMVLRGADGYALVGLFRSRPRMIGDLERLGYEPRLIKVPLIARLFPSLLWLYLKRHNFLGESLEDKFEQVIKSDLQDWVLEMSAAGECPLHDVPEMAKRFGQVLPEVETSQARECIEGLLSARLIVLSEVSDGVTREVDGDKVNEILASPRTWIRSADNGSPTFVSIATTAGQSVNRGLVRVRASTKLES